MRFNSDVSSFTLTMAFHLVFRQKIPLQCSLQPLQSTLQGYTPVTWIAGGAMILTGGARIIAPPALKITGGAMKITGGFTD